MKNPLFINGLSKMGKEQELKAKASGNTHIEPGKRKNGLQVTINFMIRDKE
jgi:hypothetical protein